MAKIYLSVLAVAVSAPLLGGCALFSPEPLAKQSRNWVPDKRDPQEYAQSQMDMGKEALALEQYGLAIISFRNALRFPAHRAEAENGLGVAFAKIGRNDLARRYFAAAAERDPSDKRFSANLARLDMAMAGQQLDSLARQDAAAASSVTSPAAASNRIAARTEGVTMIRVRPNAVSIVTVEPASDRAAGRRRVAVTPTVASAEVAGRRRNPNYPVRVWFGSPSDTAQHAALVVR